MGTRPGVARSRRRPVPVPDARAVAPRRSRRCSTRSPACSASPASATTCATCSAAAEPAARLAVDYFVYRAAKEIGALAAVLGGVDALVFTAGIGENSAEIRRRICEASAWLGIELDADGERRAAARGSPTPEQPRVGLGDPDQRRTDDRPAHRARCWACRSAARSGRQPVRRHHMAATASRTEDRRRDVAWHGFRTGLWQKEINVRDFIQQNYTPYDGDESFLAPATRAHEGHLGDAQRRCSSRSARRACSTSRRSPARSPRTRPATSTASNEIIVGLQTDAPLKRAIMPNGGFRMVAERAQDLRLRARSARRRDVHQVPQDAQRGRVRRLHRRHPALPQLAHPHRAARRLRPRPDHRRLPPRRRSTASTG